MIKLIVAATICVVAGGLSSQTVAAPVSEATVDKACGNQIEGGCNAKQCATGCEKTENGQLVSYGCIFPNKTGATKATCSRTPLGRKVQGTSKKKEVIGKRPILSSD